MTSHRVAPPFSIIIAAHNEADVIGRCLDSLAAVAVDGSAHVIVVCNGCVDSTADFARGRPGVTVVELSTASKTAALRAGDREAVGGPRLYLDADVVMTASAARAVARVLREGKTLAARPPTHFDTTHASWPVRRWYEIRQQLPSISTALWGSGTYALSVAGRELFDEFPDIVSDDLFIDQLIAADERVIVDTDPVTVHTPRRLADLLRILNRSYRTQHEVGTGTAASPRVSSGQRSQITDLQNLLRRRPSQLMSVLVYMAVIAAARLRARFVAPSVAWERDNSSRVGGRV